MSEVLLERAHLGPRAEALAPTVRGALVELGRALGQDAVFAPATSERAFRIGAADGFDIVILPALFAALTEQAPRIQVALLRPDVGHLGARLERGDYELYFGVLPNRELFSGLLPDPGTGALRTTAVYEESWVCVVRRGHPRIRRAPSLAAYAQEPHILYSPTGGGPGVVDRLLADAGLSRRVVLRVSSFHSALDCVASSDAIWTGPARIAAALDPTRKLVHLRPPLALPDYSPHLVWHERFDADPGQRWLRAQILATARARRARPA